MRASALLSYFLLAACGGPDFTQVAPPSGLPLAGPLSAPTISEYRIRPGDQLDIKFYYSTNLNEQVTVRPDGAISLQLIDEVMAAGLTPRQLTQTLRERYRGLIEQPAVSVNVRSFTGQVVYAGGEVVTPQMINLVPGLTVMQAILHAGGMRDTADARDVILIRKGPQNQPIPYRVDLSDQALERGSRDFGVALQPSDVIYVAKSPIARADQFARQYVQQLLLFQGFNLGFQGIYQINGGSTVTSSGAAATTH
ncbi:MAG: polysaccharide biosynthesis/export family protein [Stellaceae bacterium]